MEHIDVLIIDDEQKFALMLSRRIKLRGYQSKVCHNGRDAIKWLEALTSNYPALILLDLQLPDLYGTTVLTRIKKINPALPVIIVTGHGTEKDQRECERHGAYTFLHKPLDIDKLMITLNDIKGSSK